MNEKEKSSNHASFLIADCGTVTTTVALFDTVAGHHRLVARASAPTTADAPQSNLLVGIRQAIRQISEITGRVLLDERGQLMMPAHTTGAGVDHFGATVSAAPPLRGGPAPQARASSPTSAGP